MPLILTLALDEASQARFDALRTAHFPAGRHHVGAHVTLFHALPDALAVREDVRAAAAVPGFAVRVARLRSLGRGVAYVLESEELAALRRDLASGWDRLLTPQDRRPHAPHVTVQNTVPPDRARALLADLSAGFLPYDVAATGLAVWRYLGGPWEHVETAPFLAT